MLRASQGPRRRTLALLVLPALLLRALLPPGFMPAAHSGFGFALTICPGHGLMATVVDPSDGSSPSPAPAGSHHDAPCSFATAASLAPPPALPPVDATAAALERAVPLPVAALNPRPDVRAQSPRGPPALA